MTSERRSVAPGDAEDLVLADLIEAFEARLRAGEAIDAEQFAKEHPAHAERLCRLLPGVTVLADLESSAAGPVPDGATGGILGDFRILRQIGRGGMGVVYAAEQISLRRRVALKVLPLAATLDPRQLQRFHNEAQAAACLHHTNIVPVYFVGCERGVHFYVMQLIDGQPLSTLILQLRRQEDTRAPAAVEQTAVYRPAPGDAIATSPTPVPAAEVTPLSGTGRRGRDFYRKVAELGVQAAEALDHAHQLGIVHRDVKPANLMLDGGGRLWVTDFGLAHVQQAEASLTLTGQALGTPRYMSPEQALARRVPIDHRTDIYSLGVTLYELLTLQPAFTSDDRQELLRQIAFEDPVLPRRLERGIPAELETIVLKAMEKRPQDRYGTAKELADDLERWLRHEPIRARRPSLRERAQKWAYRHKAVVRSAAAMLLLAVILLAASTVAIWKAKEETEQALSERTSALEQAREQEQKAIGYAAEASKQQARADDNFRQAIEEISRLVQAAHDPVTGRPPRLEEVRKTQADRSFAFYQRLLKENRTDPAGRLQTGLVYRALMHYSTNQGDVEKTLEVYHHAADLFRQLKTQFPDNPDYGQECEKNHLVIRNFIIILSNKAISEMGKGGYEEAVKYMRQAVIVAEELKGEQPDWILNHAILGSEYCRLGQGLWLAGHTKEAEEYFSRATAILGNLKRDAHFYPAGAWRDAALAYLWRGRLRAESGRLLEAEADFKDALEQCQKMARLGKVGVRYQLFVFALAQESLGEVLWIRSKHDEAAAAFGQAENTWVQMQNTPRTHPPYTALARFYACCPDRTFRKPARAVELAKKGIEDLSGSGRRILRDDADCWQTLGLAQYRTGDWKAAETAVEKAMQLRKGGDGMDWLVLAMAHEKLGDWEKARTEYGQAVQWIDKNRPRDEGTRRLRKEAAEVLGIKEK